ncbi:MAG: PAS domain S-box protein [Caenispirillum sp.]|nr:PAS domain S-box protein [Caenispirillum sp.]
MSPSRGKRPLHAVAAGAGLSFLIAGLALVNVLTERDQKDKLLRREAAVQAQAISDLLSRTVESKNSALSLAVMVQRLLGAMPPGERADVLAELLGQREELIALVLLDEGGAAEVLALRSHPLPLDTMILRRIASQRPEGLLAPIQSPAGDIAVQWNGTAIAVYDWASLLRTTGVLNTRSVAIRRAGWASGIANEVALFDSPDAVTAGTPWQVAVLPARADLPLATLFMFLGVAAGSGITVTKLLHLLDRYRRSQRELNNSRQRLANVFASSSDWWWETDAEGRFQFLSEGFDRVIGMSGTALLGKTREALATTEDDRRTIADLAAVMSRREPFRGVGYTLQRPDGTRLHVRISGQPRYDADGGFLGYSGSGADVTQEVESAARARAAESRLMAAVEGMAEGIGVFDIGGALALHNSRLKRLLAPAGATVDTGATLPDLMLAAAKDPAPLREILGNRFAHQLKPIRFETTDDRWLICRMAPSRDNGTLTLWADITKDVQLKAEAQRIDLENRRLQKLEAIGTLAGGIAHEINTPIQYIGDNLRFLRTAFEDYRTTLAVAASLRPAALDLDDAWTAGDIDYLVEEVPQALQQSLDGIENVARIVLAMKEFSHPTAKEHSHFDLNRAVETTATVCRNEWKHVATLTLDLAPTLPPVFGLPGEINQVLLNLIVNAAHAVGDAGRPDGRITITTRAVDGEAEVTVSDTGTGIPDAIRDRIFDPFFTTKEVGRGTGQGLAIVHDIVVRKHGGTVSVTSTPGAGSTFALRLPLDSRHSAAASPAPDPTSERSAAS